MDDIIKQLIQVQDDYIIELKEDNKKLKEELIAIKDENKQLKNELIDMINELYKVMIQWKKWNNKNR